MAEEKPEQQIPLSPEQLDIMVKNRKIMELFVSDNTLIITLDDGGQIQHKVSVESFKSEKKKKKKKDEKKDENENSTRIIHHLCHVVNKRKADEYRHSAKYDRMYG